MIIGSFEVIFGFRESTSLALRGHSDAQKCPDNIFAENTKWLRLQIKIFQLGDLVGQAVPKRPLVE